MVLMVLEGHMKLSLLSELLGLESLVSGAPVHGVQSVVVMVGSLRSAIYFLAVGTHSGWLGGGTELEKHHATG